MDKKIFNILVKLFSHKDFIPTDGLIIRIIQELKNSDDALVLFLKYIILPHLKNIDKEIEALSLLWNNIERLMPDTWFYQTPYIKKMINSLYNDNEGLTSDIRSLNYIWAVHQGNRSFSINIWKALSYVKDPKSQVVKAYINKAVKTFIKDEYDKFIRKYPNDLILEKEPGWEPEQVKKYIKAQRTDKKNFDLKIRLKEQIQKLMPNFSDEECSSWASIYYDEHEDYQKADDFHPTIKKTSRIYTQKDIALDLGISEVTLRNRLKEINSEK